MNLAPWMLVLAGLVAMYGPGLVDGLRHAEHPDDVINTLFIMGVGGWFLRFRILKLASQGRIGKQGSTLGGSLLLIAGLLIYALGKSQELPTLQIGAAIPTLGGIIAIFFGFSTLGRLSGVLFLLLFLVPLPTSIAAEISQPVKLAVSIAAETILHKLDYPIARDGAILAIGQYQLLVADACSGLRSLFTLEAIGLMYLTLIGHASAVRTTVLGLLIVPISFTANTLRVITLTLITYYFGDAVGQGFLHNFSGLVLFMSALLLIIGIDTILTRLTERNKRGGS